MKKVLLMLLLCFNLSAVSARENVTIVYAFGVADNQMNYYRALAERANSLQDKYNFLVDVKGGAGSTVAARYVLTAPNTILATSSAHFIRPVLFPTESHRVEDYREILPLCSIPVAVSSIKYKNWASVPKDKPISIGVAGIGSATHLFAMELKKRYPNLEPIPFKGVSDGMTTMLGGNVDFNSSFLADTVQWNQLTVLGTTGTSRKNNIPTLVENGFTKELGDFDIPQHLVVPVTVNDAKAAEWRDALYRASKSSSVSDKYAPDFCKPMDISDSNLNAWYHKQNAHWSKIASGVKADIK